MQSVQTAFGFFPDKEVTAETAGTSSTANTGSGAAAAQSPAPVGSEPSTSKAGVGEGQGEGETSQAAGEDKENDAAAVTAVIWKELAELSAVQAKLKVSTTLALLSNGALLAKGGGEEGFGNAEGSCSRQQGLQAL